MENKTDVGDITETSWAGVIIKWYNREQHSVLHNDMGAVTKV